ncbi:MAG: hypothetical protein O3A20_03080 [Planctomycetota bacterium]|nr:hypothetical protein [Planctomycetota bacterium]
MTKGKPKPGPAPQPHRKGPWSHREHELIKQQYGKISDQALARRLNRPLASLRTRLVRIFDGKPRRSGPWQPSELEELKDLLGRAEIQVVARRLCRAQSDIENRIELLRGSVKAHPWTSDEKQQLKRDYGSRTDRVLSLILAQPAHAIAAMAEELCLSKDKTFLHRAEGVRHVSMPRWSEAEIERLRELYPTNRNEEIAHILNRSTKSVVSKAHDLELKKSKERLREMGQENVRLRHERERGESGDGGGGAEAEAEAEAG